MNNNLKQNIGAILFALAILTFGILILTPHKAKTFQPYFNQTTCSSVSTQIFPGTGEAVTSSYSTFYAQNQSGSVNVYLCPAAKCTTTTGIQLTNTATYGTPSIPVNNWTVPWSCITSSSTAVIGWYIQE